MARVLLVEDDNNLREIYEARLKAEGYEIVSAANGEEALVVAKEKKPDLIIADIMMPKISGFEMLDILRNTAGLQDVKIIMLTALSQADDQQKATKLGADKYLVKSQVTLEDIVNSARDLLENKGSTPPAAPSSAAAQEPAQPPHEPPVPTADSTATAPPAQTTAAPPAPASSAVDDKLLTDTLTSLGGGDNEAKTTDSQPTAPITPPTPTVIPVMDTPQTPPTPAQPDAPPPTPMVSQPDSTEPVAKPAEESTPPPVDDTGPAAPPPPPESPLEINKDLESQLKEESKEVESADTNQSTGAATSSGPLPVVPPPDPGADSTTLTSNIEEESETSPMKIIKPLPSEDKKTDINTLLEQEQLKESTTTSPQPDSGAPTDPDAVQIVKPSSEDSSSAATNIAL